MSGYDDWARLAGETLTATDDAGVERSLTLAEVSPAHDADGWVSFTLDFRGGTDFPVQQQTYRLTGAGIGEPVFLVPRGRTVDEVWLEAVFTQATVAPAIEEENR